MDVFAFGPIKSASLARVTRAFRQGASYFRALVGKHARLLPITSCSAASLGDRALDRTLVKAYDQPLCWLQGAVMPPFSARPNLPRGNARAVASRCGAASSPRWPSPTKVRSTRCTMCLEMPRFCSALCICLVAALWLGLRGALVVIVCVAFIDRGHALALPVAPETGTTAGIIALLVKLVLAGGLGMVLDSRRHTLSLNAELRREVAARKQSEESLQHSESLQRALVESLGEGVGLFDSRRTRGFREPGAR